MFYIQSKLFIIEEKPQFSYGEIIKEYYYAAYNKINNIPKQIVVDHQVFQIFNVVHLSEKVDDPHSLHVEL